MKRNFSLSSSCFLRAGLAALVLTMAAGISQAQQAAAFRRFAMRDGKTFYAVVESRTGTAVTFKLQSGKSITQRIADMSDPDQQYVRRWTKFKDQLVNNAEFSKITVKDLLDLRGYQSFEFDIHGNHIYVDTEVGGKPMTMMLDTGAQSTVFHVEAAKANGLEVGPFDQKIFGVAGEAPAAITKVSSIKIGDVEVTNRQYLSADLTPAGMNPKECGGILGADFMREMDAVVSYREGRLFLRPAAKAAEADKPGPKTIASEFRRWTMADGKNFFAAIDEKSDTEVTFRFQNKTKAPLAIDKLSEGDQDMVKKWSKLRDELAKDPQFRTLTVKELLELRNYQSFQYRPSGNHILVDGLVGATKAVFLIDTGAYNGVFHVDFTKKAGLEMGPMDQEIHGIGGTAPAAITKVPSLRMGDALIENRELLSADLFKNSSAFGKGIYDAIFGADFLRQLDGVINYKEGRMFLKPDQSDKPEDAADASKESEPSKEGAPKAADAPKGATPPKSTAPAKPADAPKAGTGATPSK